MFWDDIAYVVLENRVHVQISLPREMLPGRERLPWLFDPIKDELKVLIFYDGIHDSGDGADAKDQVARFVKNGDAMILDWPLHLEMATLRTIAQNETAKPLLRAWAELGLSIKSEPVGHYRECDGRIGALQLVTIPRAKEFVSRLNALNRNTLYHNRQNRCHKCLPKTSRSSTCSTSQTGRKPCRPR
jgi:hypothetical protein